VSLVRRSYEVTLFSALALVVAGFVLSSVFGQMVVERIHGAATDITRDKAPSVEYLAAARSDMHELEVAVLDFVNSGGDGGDISKIEGSEQRLQSNVAAYFALPTDEEEVPFVHALEQTMGDLREATGAAVARAQALDDAGARDVIQSRIRPTVDRARTLMIEDIALNARQAHRDAEHIDAWRAQSRRVTWALDIVMAVLAGVIAVIAGRTLRRFAKLIEDVAARERERANEMELFSARIAHDVLSPLAPVALSLDLLGGRFENDPRAKELVQRSRTGVEKVKRLVEDLLAFARSGARATPAHVAEVGRACDEVVTECAAEAEAAEVALHLLPMSRLAVVCPDALLEDALRNLLRNAIRHMGAEEERHVFVRAEARGARVLVEVEDTGPGLPPGLELRIFEPYVRGSQAGAPGLGLGLATVKRIVEAHHGEVGARNRRQGGAVFWFTLPRASTEEAQLQVH
jgi:signal transduction histidine kinase